MMAAEIVYMTERRTIFSEESSIFILDLLTDGALVEVIHSLDSVSNLGILFCLGSSTLDPELGPISIEPIFYPQPQP